LLAAPVGVTQHAFDRPDRGPPLGGKPEIPKEIGQFLSGLLVPGSVHRDNAARTIDFKVSDGVKTYPVTYHGLVPDTFTDANDIEVVVEGRLGRNGVIRATDVLAKCGSRYEAVPKA